MADRKQKYVIPSCSRATLTASRHAVGATRTHRSLPSITSSRTWSAPSASRSDATNAWRVASTDASCSEESSVGASASDANRLTPLADSSTPAYGHIPTLDPLLQ